MFLLTDKDGNILNVANSMVFGEFEGEEKWALYDEIEHIVLYALDHDYTAIEYDGEVPADISEFGKYLYQNGSIVENPDWIAPPPTTEERIAALETTIAAQDELLADILLTI